MPRSLREFATKRRWAKTRAACRVCQLPKRIRDELHRAGLRGFKREEVFAWLTEECGIKNITRDQIRAHRTGRHDAQA